MDSAHVALLLLSVLLFGTAAVAGCQLIDDRNARSLCETDGRSVMVHAYDGWACVPGHRIDG